MNPIDSSFIPEALEAEAGAAAGGAAAAGAAAAEDNVTLTAASVAKLIRERGPFFALSVAEKMPVGPEQSKAFGMICVRLSDNKKFGEAAKLLKRISHVPTKTETIEKMVFWLLHQMRPNPDQALVFIKMMRQQKTKSSCLKDICREFVQRGKLEKALEVANTIHHDWDKSAALGLVAEGYFNKGEIETAKAIANSIPNAGKKTTILNAIASNGQTSWF